MKSVLTTTLAAVAPPAAAPDAKLEKGGKVYAEQKCSMCHSIAGKGNAKGSFDEIGTKLKLQENHQWIVEPATMSATATAERQPAMPSKYSALPWVGVRGVSDSGSYRMSARHTPLMLPIV